jgi:hypothetical protein
LILKFVGCHLNFLGEFSHYGGIFLGNFFNRFFKSVNWKKIAKILEKIAKLSKPQIFYKSPGYK